VFQHVRSRDARKGRSASRRGEREGETDEVMVRIADDSLIEIANLNFNAPFGVGNRAKIAGMTIPTNPYRRPCRNVARCALIQPFIKLDRATPHESVRRAGHFQIARRGKVLLAIARGHEFHGFSSLFFADKRAGTLISMQMQSLVRRS
jgi:hypothetical protein